MPSWLKKTLYAAVVIIAIWVLVIVYWRTKMHMPSASDVAIYLVVMPLTLLLSIYSIQRFGRGLLTLTAVTDVHASKTTENTATQQNQTTEAARAWTATILATAIHTRFGQASIDIIGAIKNKKTQFELDSELTDTNGYPILSGRIENLDTSDVMAQFVQFTKAHTLPEQNWQVEDIRSITLAHNVCLELGLSLIANPHLSDTIINHQNKKQGTPITMPTVYLTCLLPMSWTEPQKQQVTSWLISLLTTQGFPHDCIMPHPLNAFNLDDPLLSIDKINIQINQQVESGLHFIIASHSFIGEQAIMAMTDMQDKHRKIPGEAGAGLIISNLQWAEKLALPSAIKVHRLAQFKRDKSADAGGKIKPDILVKAMEDALKTAHIEATDIKDITSDSDDRPTRIGELYEAINIVFPEIDVSTNSIQIPVHCGEIGTVAGLLAIAAATDQAKENQQAVLCVCNNDGVTRSAIILNITSTDPK